MARTNHASWLMTKQAPVNVVDSAPYTQPGENEIVIKTKAIAINPADVYLQKLGILITDYPAILGCDVAGEVVEVDPSLASQYNIGDRVISTAGATRRKNDVYCYSAFQEYVVAPTPSIAKIAKHVSYEDAVVLPLGIQTAASCLFIESTMGLIWPFDGSKPGKGKTILVWGASSSVGSCGIQLAVHAGYDVVGVASKRNHDMVKGMGASLCFDYNDDTIVDDILEGLKGKDLIGAYAAIVVDPILKTLCEILDRNGSGKLLVSVRPGSENMAERGVKITTNVAATSPEWRNGDVLKGIWKWVETSMEDNTIKYLPQSEVVGKGLEDIQKAVDLLAGGVSAKKLVVSI